MKRFAVSFAVCALLTLVQGSNLRSAEPVDTTWYWWMYVDRGHVGPFGEGDTGYDSSIALNTKNEPWIAYYLKSNSEGGSHDLMLSRMTLPEGTWTTETVDSVGNVGKWCSLAIDNGDRPHIAYYDELNADLKYAFHDGTAWQIHVVDADGFVGAYCSLALFGASQPMIAYYGDVDVGLRVATYDGSAWTIETADGGRGQGWYTSIAVGRDQAPHIAYYDPVNTALKYATKTGGAWTTTTVDPGGNVGDETRIALDVDGLPQIAYRDADNEALKYAIFNGASWSFETVDDVSRVRNAIGFVIDDANMPHIAYYNADTVTPLMAVRDGGWSFKTIQFPNFVWLEVPPGPRGEDLSLAAARTRGTLGHIAMRDNRESSLVWGQSGFVSVPPGDPAPLLSLTGYTGPPEFTPRDVEVPTTNDAFANAGDVNGDDIDDVIIGAAGDGEVHLLYGGDPAVLATVAIQTMTDVTLTGITPGDGTGLEVARAGDVNGDGFEDLLISASLADPGGLVDAGQVYIVYGGPALPAAINLAAANVTLTGASAGDLAGKWVSSAGDVNGDGFDDVIVGAEGKSYVVYGGLALPPTMALSGADMVFTGLSSLFKGRAVSPGGDINGDGTDDLLMGPGPLFNQFYVFYGGPALPAAPNPVTDADVTISIDVPAPIFSLASAGDFNNDGYGDFIAGLPWATVNTDNDGQACLFFGGPALPSAMTEADAGITIEGSRNLGFCGMRVASAGDINGDSFDDVIIESPQWRWNPFSFRGPSEPGMLIDAYRTFILRGGASLPDRLRLPGNDRTYFDVPVGFTDFSPRFYYAMNGVGDLNDDGVDDLLIRGAYAEGLSSEANLVYSPYRSFYKVTQLIGDTFEFLADTHFEDTVLNPRMLTPIHFGPATNADILFGIDTKSAGYFFYEMGRNRTYTLTPGTLEEVDGYGSITSLWTDGAVRIPDQLLSWDPDGDGDDELWAFLGTSYYVFDWTTQQFGPAIPLADIGASGLSFDALAALDRGDGMELLVGAADTDLFVYNPTTFAGTVFPSVTLTTGGVPLRATCMVSIDANLDGTDVLYIVDLEANTVWTGLETGIMTRAAFFSSLWPRGVSKMVSSFQDTILAYKAFDGPAPPRVYGIHHDVASDREGN